MCAPQSNFLQRINKAKQFCLSSYISSTSVLTCFKKGLVWKFTHLNSPIISWCSIFTIIS